MANVFNIGALGKLLPGVSYFSAQLDSRGTESCVYTYDVMCSDWYQSHATYAKYPMQSGTP